MYLRFNEGAIVRFTLISCANPVSVVGKVIRVFPDEVEICTQLGVVLNGCGLDCSTTADSDTILHICRNHIQSWTYAKFSDFDFPIRKRIYFDNRHTNSVYNITSKHFSDHIFNHFKEDGFCKGTGRYCGNIKSGNQQTG